MSKSRDLAKFTSDGEPLDDGVLEASDIDLGNVDNVSAADLRDRSTHTGTQAATTVSYDNTASGLVATDVKGAVDELQGAKVAQTDNTGSAEIPSGTQTQRDASPSAGYFRFNTDTSQFEGYDGTEWGKVGGGGAIDIDYDNSTSGLPANNVQDAIDQITNPEAFTASFTYDSSTTSPAGTGNVPQSVLDNLYANIKGCTLLDNGSVNYYLNASDWSLKEGGGSSDLTGTDGQVMVEIPAFYYKVERSGTQTTWFISDTEFTGFSLHPAFIVDGVEVSHRYYSAYDACVYDDSASAYISGTNNTDNSGNVDTGADLLASVKGIYPMVGLTRNEFRLLAANRGSRWRQVDFPLWCAVGMLYVVEYQTFYNQDELGDGNTNGSYVGSSSNQNDSPHTIAGAGDSWGNGSTDGTQPSAGAKPGTAYMKYRGIENQFGNCWNWADAINVNVGGTGNVHIANDNARANYADDTTTDYTLATSSLTTGSDNIQRFLPVDPYFLAESVGGSSAQYITDRHYGSSSSNRVFRVGGSANLGGDAGVFTATADRDSGGRVRDLGGRLAY